MALDSLVPDQILDVSFVYLKRWSDVFHFLHEGVPPQGIPVLVINLNGLLHRLWNSDAVLMGPYPVLRFNLGNNS